MNVLTSLPETTVEYIFMTFTSLTINISHLFHFCITKEGIDMPDAAVLSQGEGFPGGRLFASVRRDGTDRSAE